MSQKAYHMRYEKIILGRIRCEKAPQVVRAWSSLYWINIMNTHLHPHRHSLKRWGGRLCGTSTQQWGGGGSNCKSNNHHQLQYQKCHLYSQCCNHCCCHWCDHHCHCCLHRQTSGQVCPSESPRCTFDCTCGRGRIASRAKDQYSINCLSMPYSLSSRLRCFWCKFVYVAIYFILLITKIRSPTSHDWCNICNVYRLIDGPLVDGDASCWCCWG